MTTDPTIADRIRTDVAEPLTGINWLIAEGVHCGPPVWNDPRDAFNTLTAIGDVRGKLNETRRHIAEYISSIADHPRLRTTAYGSTSARDVARRAADSVSYAATALALDDALKAVGTLYFANEGTSS